MKWGGVRESPLNSLWGSKSTKQYFILKKLNYLNNNLSIRKNPPWFAILVALVFLH